MKYLVAPFYYYSSLRKCGFRYYESPLKVDLELLIVLEIIVGVRLNRGLTYLS